MTTSGAHVGDPGCYTDRACLARHHIVRFDRAYLPSPDYWPRQLLETGVLLALTVLTVAVAFAVLRGRSRHGDVRGGFKTSVTSTAVEADAPEPPPDIPHAMSP